MKLFLSVLVIFLLTASVSTSAAASSPDTLVPPTHRLTEQQFLSAHGKSDSARALIRYYFTERKTSRTAVIISPLLIGAGAVAISYIIDSSMHILESIVLVSALASLMFYLTILLFLTSFRLLAFSRKKLLKHLKALEAGRPLPGRITRKGGFRAFLKKEQART